MQWNERERKKRDQCSQWAFDTLPILNRFHLWLEDVDVNWLKGNPTQEYVANHFFLASGMEHMMAMTAGVTALGTYLFGRFGEGAGKSKSEFNRIKKDADAISAYAMSEGLWFASRHLPENHAIMVSLGEGLMPKAGETPEMGSNPQLGFGRIYARPAVARWLEQRVARLLNEIDYDWKDFYSETKATGITVWGAAIDTLENTSRFAKGDVSGPMTIMHLYDQPLSISKPYEGYMGNLILPREIVEKAARNSVLIDFRSPRSKVVEAIEATYPGIRRQDIHVWTLGGSSRKDRIGELWDEWRNAGAHLVEDTWILPNGNQPFTESGTYAPVHLIGTWKDDQDRTHLFLCDGYAASAEAVQAATLAALKNLDASMVVYSSKFKLGYKQEGDIMSLDELDPGFESALQSVSSRTMDDTMVESYRQMIREARSAGLPLVKRVLREDDFFPEKRWQMAAVSGYMLPDPYTDAKGVTKVGDNIYKVVVRVSSHKFDKCITFTLRLKTSMEESRLVFNPLLIRFIYGEDYRSRPVKISDSGRIRNELQTLCSEALEHFGAQGIRIHFDRISPDVISNEDQKVVLEVLRWYKLHHPIWFKWLDIVGPGESIG